MPLDSVMFKKVCYYRKLVRYSDLKEWYLNNTCWEIQKKNGFARSEVNNRDCRHLGLTATYHTVY